MDAIQKTLVKAGRKDLAQEYYKKVNKKAGLSNWNGWILPGLDITSIDDRSLVRSLLYMYEELQNVTRASGKLPEFDYSKEGKEQIENVQKENKTELKSMMNDYLKLKEDFGKRANNIFKKMESFIKSKLKVLL